MKFKMPDVMYGLIERETQFPAFATGYLDEQDEPTEFLVLYSDREEAASGAEELDADCEIRELAGAQAIIDYIEGPAAMLEADYKVMVDRIDETTDEALVFEREALVQGLRTGSWSSGAE